MKMDDFHYKTFSANKIIFKNFSLFSDNTLQYNVNNKL